MWSPISISELEYNFDKIIEFINNDDHILNIYGNLGCGKTTVVKLYLKNVSYHYIDDFNVNLNNFINFIEKLSKIDVLSYFTNTRKNSIIVIDNYDLYNFNYKDIFNYIKHFKVIIISRYSYFKNNVYIPDPSSEYLEYIKCVIKYFTNNTVINTTNFLKLHASINFGQVSIYDSLLETRDNINKIIDTKDISIIIDDINAIQQSFLYYVYDISKASWIYNNISYSVLFLNTDYYQPINSLSLLTLDTHVTKLYNININYSKKNKIIKECKNLNCQPTELSLVKTIKKKYYYKV